MSKHAISGFPEWTPAERAVEMHVENTLARVFELHGFQNLRTRSVEPLSALEAKGETSKEVYLLQRLQSARESDEPIDLGPNTLGLHFDLTVPLARYVVANSGSLVFPFKRYQIQQVWRGERPQEGRFREFTQADIDVVGQDQLAFHHDIEVAETMLDALNALGIGDVLMEVNNRKLLSGLVAAVGASDFDGVLRALDKLDKIGEGGVREELSNLDLTDEQATKVIEFAAITATTGKQLDSKIAALGLELDAEGEEGLEELKTLLDSLAEFAPGQVKASLRIARGLDYYTGTVYETLLPGYENYGSICSGGRYDNLARAGRKTYPGVGLSVGVTRLVALILEAGLLQTERTSPAAVLVLVNNEEERGTSEGAARQLRSRGINAEVSPSSAKFGRQIRYADRKGIPYVCFVRGDEYSIKNIVSGEQVDGVDLSTWQPDESVSTTVSPGVDA